MSWTSDGLHLALGFLNGSVHLCDKNGAEKVNITRSAPVWSLAWSSSAYYNQNTLGTSSGARSGIENTFDILVVGTWDQTLSFYKTSGQEFMT
jgi:hypothetical protein